MNTILQQRNIPYRVNRIVNVPSDGDCLFWAIAHSMAHEHTNQSLRRLVAQSVLFDHPLLLTSCAHWKNLCEVVEDFQFYRNLRKEPLPLSPQNKKKLYQNLMNADLYWGDEYALTVLAVLLRRNLYVFRKETNGGLTLTRKRPISRRHDPVFVYLAGLHYFGLHMEALVVGKMN